MDKCIGFNSWGYYVMANDEVDTTSIDNIGMTFEPQLDIRAYVKDGPMFG
jgi:hypothetical protein